MCYACGQRRGYQVGRLRVLNGVEVDKLKVAKRKVIHELLQSNEKYRRIAQVGGYKEASNGIDGERNMAGLALGRSPGGPHPVRYRRPWLRVTLRSLTSPVKQPKEKRCSRSSRPNSIESRTRSHPICTYIQQYVARANPFAGKRGGRCYGWYRARSLAGLATGRR